MSSLTGLNASLVKLHDDLTRELEFTSEAKRQIGDAFQTAREALAQLDNIISQALDERIRAVAAAIGTDAPTEPVAITAKRWVA